MLQQLQIVIKDIPHSKKIEDHIRQQVERLERFYEGIISCHVAVEMSEKRHNSLKLYNVRIKTLVPKHEFVTTRQSRDAQENLWLAIHDAFDAMREDMQFYSNLIHRKVKTHDEDLNGEVVRLFDGYGFIEGLDGTEYYFNSLNVVKNKFDKLKVGTPVHFIEKLGYESLQACRVRTRRHKASAL